jgi:hypothetical protein
MSNVKISELSAAATLDGTEEVPIVQSSSTVRTTAQAIADLGGGGLGYLVYTALLSQTSTDPIAADELKNTIGVVDYSGCTTSVFSIVTTVPITKKVWIGGFAEAFDVSQIFYSSGDIQGSYSIGWYDSGDGHWQIDVDFVNKLSSPVALSTLTTGNLALPEIRFY